MKTVNQILDSIGRGDYDKQLKTLYPARPPEQNRKRYQDLLNTFKNKFGDKPAILVSAPGRTEICGNHTDHQNGNILAAGVDLDIICVAAPNDDNVIRIHSAGFPPDEIKLDDLSVRAEETGHAAALIRGLSNWFLEQKVQPHGFDACTTSDILKGSGLSSSAAFEVCVGMAMNVLWQGGKVPVDIAIAGKYAENRYFGKPSGLMDQLACAVGGFIQVDFGNPDKPLIQPVTCDLAAHGYHLCIVDTKGDHADLTDEYASIPADMKKVCDYFGKRYLSEVDEKTFWERITSVRPVAGDRAVLRAIHFFKDNKLAVETAELLRKENIEHFLANITRSGRSSFCYLQNVYSNKDINSQELSLALAVSESILDGQGAWRVHGGGFAGTIQAFVPNALLKTYRDEMNRIFGTDACKALSIRPIGVTQVMPEKEEVSANG